jgi:2-dehydro-3-deoxygluconokinase
MFVCFGEIMLRLSPPDHVPLRQAARLDMVYGGAEANVAAALSGFGVRSAMVTALPDNDLGDACVAMLDGFGVQTRNILRTEGRMGVYYLEKGASVRPSKVVYDRQDSAFARARHELYDWDAILDGACGLHFTGITPALGAEARTALFEAVSAARKKRMLISCDINFRRNLWSREDANACMGELLPMCDVLITNPGQVKDVFFFEERDDAALARRLCAEYGVSTVALSGRDSLSADDNTLHGSLYSAREDRLFCSRRYGVHIVDRIGGGDAFAAGLIYGLLKGLPPQETIELSVAADAYKHTLPGDAMHVKLEDVLSVARGDISGNVKR